MVEIWAVLLIPLWPTAEGLHDYLATIPDNLSAISFFSSKFTSEG
jgi:hypothetical protein